MDAPPVQYVTTSDGYSIAYAVSGEGPALVMMYDLPHACFDAHWHNQRARTLLEPLASRFRLVQFDSRGNGNSTRNLAATHRFDDYLIDLEAVVDRLGLSSLILFAPVFAAHVISRFAIKYPHRVEGLIYLNPAPAEDAWLGMRRWDGLYSNDWDLFIDSYTRVFFPEGNEFWSNYLREVVTQPDFLKHAAALSKSSLTEALPRLTAPALVLGSRQPASTTMATGMRQFASLIPNARLVLFEGRQNQEIIYSRDSSLPPAIPVIEEFVSGLRLRQADSQPVAAADALSDREIEVLRLLAQGKSNPEIAKELFITRNTVQNHVGSILIKTNLNNRTEAAVYAKEHGLA